MTSEAEMSKQDFRPIYFCEFKLRRSATQTAQYINEMWCEGSIIVRTVQLWFQIFRQGDLDLQEKCGHWRFSVVYFD